MSSWIERNWTNKMIKVLYVGDPHFKYAQKDEMNRLMNFVHETASNHKVDQITLLGDLNDTFGVLRTDNLFFWSNWLFNFGELCVTNVLVGNHDKKNQGNDDDLENSLDVFNSIGCKHSLNIIQSPITLGIFRFIPYIHNKARFLLAANVDAISKVLICHAEFEGGQFDNGYYIPDGIKQEDLNPNYNTVISGHIHTRATIGKVRYPGTARWLTSSDANKEKGIWLVEHDSETGAILKEEFLDTSHVCTPIYAYEYKEGGNCPVIPEGSRASIELIGSSEWVSKEKGKFKGLASISTKITDKTRPVTRKAGNSLEDFVSKVFEPVSGVKKASMLAYMRELGILKHTELS